MADEAVRAPALGGVTERLDAQYDAHGADDDDVPITRSEGTKQNVLCELYRHYCLQNLIRYNSLPLNHGKRTSCRTRSLTQ